MRWPLPSPPPSLTDASLSSSIVSVRPPPRTRTGRLSSLAGIGQCGVVLSSADPAAPRQHGYADPATSRRCVSCIGSYVSPTFFFYFSIWFVVVGDFCPPVQFFIFNYVHIAVCSLTCCYCILFNITTVADSCSICTSSKGHSWNRALNYFHLKLMLPKR